MTVIAWDGKHLAADRLATCGDTLSTTTKIQRIVGGAVAWCGDLDCGLQLRDWYMAGASAEQYPAFQKDKDRWARLIVARHGVVVVYEREPVAQTVEDEFCAWGVGREAALGAMAMGASAEQAVTIASKFVAGCGRGATVVEVPNG